MTSGKPKATSEKDLPAQPARSNLGFPVVGLGASAGGLPALNGHVAPTSPSMYSSAPWPRRTVNARWRWCCPAPAATAPMAWNTSRSWAA